MAWGIFISCITLFGTLALALADATDATIESDPLASFGEMRETQQGIEGQDIRNAA